MRSTAMWLVAAALAAAPAAAQNTMEANAVDANVANVTATAPVPDNAAVPANDMTAPAPPATGVTTAPPGTPPTAGDDAYVTGDRDRGGFPWGLVGLVGLVGLLGRRRSSD